MCQLYGSFPVCQVGVSASCLNKSGPMENLLLNEAYEKLVFRSRSGCPHLGYGTPVCHQMVRWNPLCAAILNFGQDFCVSTLEHEVQ